MFIIVLLVSLFSFTATASVNCDCQVIVHHPLTASHSLAPVTIKSYDLERFDTSSRRSQQKCRQSCLKEFRSDMSTERLNALLVTLSKELIDEKVVGYNCTGLTVLKYPVRVKAKLGDMSLGNVEDLTQVVSHEEVCF